MSELYEILKITLPSLVMLIAIYYLVKKHFEEEDRKRRLQIIAKNQELVTPLKLQAYERIILFLERISPENLLIRINKPGYTCKQLQAELLTAIKSEFDHNIAQQLYISTQAWEMVKTSKSKIIQLINSMMEKFKPEDPSITMSMAILEITMKQPQFLTVDTINFLKDEMRTLIG